MKLLKQIEQLKILPVIKLDSLINNHEFNKITDLTKEAVSLVKKED